jgi:basic membrane protein A
VVVAPQFPDVTFMIINGETSDASNLYVYGVRQGVPAYVAGVIAAELTSSGKIGFVGGVEIPPTTQSDIAFSAGATSVDPAIESVSTVVGDFDDAAKAKEAAAAQIAAGADVIFGFVNAGLPGIIDAGTESGKEINAFGVIIPRCEEFDQLVGTAVLDSGALVKSMITDYLDDSIPAEPRFYGVEDPTIQRFELCPAFATEELQSIVDETQRGIVDGEVTLPEGV